QDILKSGDLPALLRFMREVEEPKKVGIALGQIAPDNEDSEVLPKNLLSEDKSLKDFAAGFVIGRYLSKGWPWVDLMLTSAWKIEQKVELLLLLPFQQAAWSRAKNSLGNDEILYWKKVNVFGF